MKIELIAITDNAEGLIEEAGRTCYKSEEKEGNSNGQLIKRLIKSGHESVLEHASATFRISGVSRALTHQLVRHRLASYSQQSQRYVREAQFDYVTPDSIKCMEIPNGVVPFDPIKEFESDMKIIQEMYNKWKRLGLKNEDARFVLPNACCTEIVMTTNFREWRKIFQLRCDKHAQWEIRLAMKECLSILSQNNHAPNVFEDLAAIHLD